VTKAEFWRSLWLADEPEACTSAANQTFQVIADMQLDGTQGPTLMMATSRFVNTGDSTELDALLAEIADHT
jgi:hypothetical protein